MTRRTFWLFLCIIILLGLGLRSYQLTARSLWFDEAFSWRLIQFPVSEMVARAATDVHPPLYYLLLKGWAYVFASSLLALRSFSIVMAGLTIWCGYLFTAYALRSRGAGILAALLLAVSGWQIQFAWEARMYTLGTVFLLLSSWFLLRGVRHHRVLDWLGYSLTAAALLYIHYYAIFSIAAQIIFIIGYLIIATRGRIGEVLQWSLFWYAALSYFLIFLLFLPWLPTFIAQNAQVQAAYWIPAIGGWSIPDTFYRMLAPTAGIPQHSGIGWILLAVLPLIATIMGLIILILPPLFPNRTQPRDVNWLVFCSVVTPFAASILLSFIGQSLYQDRFFVFAHIFILIGLSLLLFKLPLRQTRSVLVVLVTIGFLVAYFAYWQELNIPGHPGARSAIAVAAEKFQPADRIIASSPFIFFAALHYAEEEYALPDPKLYSETNQLAHFAGEPILKSDDLIGPDVFKQPGNLWVIDTTGFGAAPLAVPAGWQRVSSQSFPEVFAHQGDVIVSYYQTGK